MKKHVKIWMEYMGVAPGDYYPCECGCGKPVCQVHHLESRGMGGRPSMDRFDNLIGLSRECHDRAHRDRAFNNYLKGIAERRTA